MVRRLVALHKEAAEGSDAASAGPQEVPDERVYTAEEVAALERRTKELNATKRSVLWLFSRVLRARKK